MPAYKDPFAQRYAELMGSAPPGDPDPLDPDSIDADEILGLNDPEKSDLYEPPPPRPPPPAGARSWYERLFNRDESKAVTAPKPEVRRDPVTPSADAPRKDWLDLALEATPAGGAAALLGQPYVQEGLQTAAHVLGGPLFEAPGMAATALQEQLAGTPESASRWLKLTPEAAEAYRREAQAKGAENAGGITPETIRADLAGRSTTSPSLGQLAVEGLGKAIPQAVAGTLDVTKAGGIAGEEPSLREASRRAMPLTSKGEALQPLAEAALDPSFLSLRALPGAAGEAVFASALPALGMNTVQGVKDYIRVALVKGFTAPEALEHAASAAASAIFVAQGMKGQADWARQKAEWRQKWADSWDQAWYEAAQQQAEDARQAGLWGGTDHPTYGGPGEPPPRPQLPPAPLDVEATEVGTPGVHIRGLLDQGVPEPPWRPDMEANAAGQSARNVRDYLREQRGTDFEDALLGALQQPAGGPRLAGEPPAEIPMRGEGADLVSLSPAAQEAAGAGVVNAPGADAITRAAERARQRMRMAQPVDQAEESDISPPSQYPSTPEDFEDLDQQIRDMGISEYEGIPHDQRPRETLSDDDAIAKAVEDAASDEFTPFPLVDVQHEGTARVRGTTHEVHVVSGRDGETGEPVLAVVDPERGFATDFVHDPEGAVGGETLADSFGGLEGFTRTVKTPQNGGVSTPPAAPALVAPEPPSLQDAPGPTTSPERRMDFAGRRRVAEMAPEELRTALLRDDLTGLGNRRAYDEDTNGGQGPQAMLDVEGLKWVNETYGKQAGDQLLQAVGTIIQEELGGHPRIRAARVGGDEIFVYGDVLEQIQQWSEHIRQAVQDRAVLVFERPDGTTVEYHGVGLHHGIGGSLAEADAALTAAKKAAVAAGQRAERGEQPRGLHEVPAPGQQARGGEAPAPPPAAPAEVAPPAGEFEQRRGEKDREVRIAEARENLRAELESATGGTYDDEALDDHISAAGGYGDFETEDLPEPPPAGPATVTPIRPEPAPPAPVQTSAAGDELHPPMEPKEITVSFPAKPSKVARDRLKGAGFKWDTKRGLWHARPTETTRVVAQVMANNKGATVAGLQPAAAAPPAPPAIEEERPKTAEEQGFTVGGFVNKAPTPAAPRPYLDPKEYRGMKTALTKAIASGDQRRILAVADAALKRFDEVVGPDDWHRWQNAKDDAEYQLRRQGEDTLPGRDLIAKKPVTPQIPPLGAKEGETKYVLPSFVTGGPRAPDAVAATRKPDKAGAQKLLDEARAQGERARAVAANAAPTFKRGDRVTGHYGTGTIADMHPREGPPETVRVYLDSGNYGKWENVGGLKMAAEPTALAAPDGKTPPPKGSPAVEPAPSPAQMEAGNYKKKHVSWNGLDIAIETEKGGTRRAKDGSWVVENMPADYGYIKGYRGNDSEQVDVFMGEHLDAPYVYAIDQVDLKTGHFDEHKIMVGFKSEARAMGAYEDAFSDNRGADRVGGMTSMSVEQFKNWLETGDLSKRIAKRLNPPVAPAAAAEPRMANEEGSYAGENLADLLEGAEREQAGRWASIRGLEETIATLKGGKAEPPPGVVKKLKRVKEELASLRQLYEDTYEEVSRAGTEADVARIRKAVEETAGAEAPAGVSSGQDERDAAGPDPGALEEAPPEDVPGAPGDEEAGRGGEGGGGPDVGRPGGPGEEGTALRRGPRGGEGAVGVPAGRGGRPGPRVRSGEPERAPSRDYRITPDDHVGEGTPRAKAKANVEAIRLLKKIEGEGRLATPEEQGVLVRYAGWGSLPQAFDPKEFGKDAGIKAIADALTDALTAEEHAAAKASTNNAHYTAPAVVEGLWKAVERLGLKPGARVLEPSMGVGHFFGLMPKDLVKGSKRTGVELDSITGRIAKLLYPQANVNVAGFEALHLPNDFFDLAISNVPFGRYPIHDPTYRKTPVVLRSIHDYFFAKALDKVRPGGVVAFITSRYTMDKGEYAMREYLASRADLLGAIRLPNTTFKTSAGTEVTTDVIFLQKRAPGQKPGGEAWKDLVHIDVPGGRPQINEYYVKHPEMMLGAMALEGTQYRGDEPALIGEFSPEKLAAAIERLPKDAIKPAEKPIEEALGKASLYVPAEGEVKENGYTVRDGDLVVRKGDRLEPAAVTATDGQRIRGMLGVRDAARDVFRTQLGEASEPAIKAARAALNRSYDAFAKKHGPLHARANVRAFAFDPDAPLLLSLEQWDPDAETATKADVFSKRTIERYKPVERADTATEALTVSLNERGRIDWPRMEQLTGRDAETLRGELGPLVYENPEGGWETADAYLSGDVRAKLAAAEAAAKTDPALRRNAEALRLVQPVDLEPGSIDARLGASWVPKEDVRTFVAELLEVPLGDVRVAHSEAIATWAVEWASGARYYGGQNVANNRTWGTERAPAMDLIGDALNLRTPTLYDADPKDSSKRVVNLQATTAAREQQQKISDRFKTWLWEDGERASRLARKYNDEFNNLRLREYDGSHLTLPGMSKLTLRGGDLAPHQKNAVWRVIQAGNTLLAHAVGAGKTFEMVAAGMEMRRIGLVKKPLYAVPNHLVGQWGAEFLRLYPTANILVAGKEHFEKGKRQQIMSRIATGNWDAVIVAHKSFEALPVSDETFDTYLQEQIDELENHIYAARGEGAGRSIVKQLEASKKRLTAKLRGRARREAKDVTVGFEELGVDALFIDEAHKFKNLFFPTKMTRVAGLPQTESNRAFDMYVKTQYITKLNNGRGVVFATGTPVSNTMAEMFTMQRYLQPAFLSGHGMAHFDAWAKAFGETVTGLELAPDGSGYRVHARFAKFTNLPELVSGFRLVADVQTAKTLKLPLPKVRGGKAEIVAPEASPALKAYVQSLVKRAELVRGIGGKKVDPHEDNMLKITGDGAKAALDMRLVYPGSRDDPGSKVNVAVARIHAIWHETKATRRTQLVFLDLSTPGPKGQRKGFNLYDDMRGKLVKLGVPEKEIAFIHDAETDAAKLQLFNAVNAGRTRILIGSTEKMGEGMNAQKRLIALHHLDAPWRPSDIEQRDGRIIRQGNENDEVQIIRYATKNSFDAYRWQTLETKARFIAQVMTGDVTVRSAEDVEGAALTYAEVKAIASGNPAVMEKVKIDSELRRLDSLRASHLNARASMRREMATLPSSIENTKARIAKTRADIATRNAAAEKDEGFSLRLGKQTFAGKGAREEAQAVLEPLVQKRYGQAEPVTVGKYLGMDVVIKGVEGFKDAEPWLTLVGEASHNANKATVFSLVAAAERMEDSLAGQERDLAASEKKLRDLKAEIDKPFEHEARVQELVKKQEELNKSLDLDKGDKQAEAQAEGDEGEPFDVDAAVEEIQEKARRKSEEGSTLIFNDVAKAVIDVGQRAYATARDFGAWSKAVMGQIGGLVSDLPGRLRRLYRYVRRNPTPSAAYAPAGAGQVATRTAPPAPAGRAPGGGYLIREEGLGDKFIRYMQDKMIRPKRVIEDVVAQGGTVSPATDFYGAEELFHGKTEEHLRDAERRFADPLVQGLARERLTLRQLDDYMEALHVPDRNATIEQRTNGQTTEGSGRSDAWAQQTLADFQRKGLTPKLDRLARIVRSAIAEQRAVMLKAGLVTPAQLQTWEAAMGKHYVPLRTAEVDGGLGTGRGFDIRGREARAATGRRSVADSPVTFALSQLQRSIVRAEKNGVTQKFADFVRANPDPGLWEIDVDHYRNGLDRNGQVHQVRDEEAYREDVDWKENGEEHRITVHDEGLRRAMKNLSAAETGELVRKIGALTRFYAALATSYSPEFLLTNPVRDIQTVLGNVGVEQGRKIAANAVKNIVPAMRGMYQELRNPGSGGRWGTLAREFREDGGSVGFYSLKDVPALEREIVGRVKRAGPGAVNAAMRLGTAMTDWIADANRSVENGTRLAVYAAMRDAGHPRDKSASVAKNASVNFNRKGEAGAAANALYAFFNANVQGTARLFQVLLTSRGAVLAGALFAAAAALDLLNRAASDDKDKDGINDYDAIPEYVKGRNFIIMPGLTGNVSKRPLMFPMPWGFNVPLSVGRLAAATTQNVVSPARAAAGAVSALVNAFNPLGGEGDVVQGLSPTFLDPVVQDATNKDFTGRPIRPEPFPGTAAKPPSENYFRNVPAVWKDLARYLNQKTGGDKITPGYISISPETMEHYWHAVFSGAGRFASNVASMAESVSKGETPSLRSVPFARRFAYEPPRGEQSQRFRENVQLLEDLWGKYKGYGGAPAKVKGMPLELVRIKPTIDAYENAIRKVRKAQGNSPAADRQVAFLQTRANAIVAAARKKAGLPVLP